MSDFAKIAAIIKSCETHDQWNVAERVVERYSCEIMRKYNNGQIGFELTFDLLNACTDLKCYLSDKLIDIIGAPQRWKIGNMDKPKTQYEYGYES